MRASDGVELAVRVLEGSGTGPTLWLSHATGFCGACWSPVIDRLKTISARLVVWDFRGHGRSGRPPLPVSWWDMAGDVAAIVSRHRRSGERNIGVGHSMGGAALVMAEISDPGVFAGLVLVEPIILGEPVARTPYPLSDVVRKRRRVFESRERAFANFSRKTPFSRWDPTALDGYVNEGLTMRDGVLQLSCVPEFEAEVYDTAHGHGLYRLLHRSLTPTTVMVGDRSDTYDVDWAKSIVAAMPNGRLVVVEGGTHFIPMEQPDRVADAVSTMIDVVSIQNAE